MDQQKPKTPKNDDNEKVRGHLSHDLPERPQEFRYGLVDESVPEHRDVPVLLMNYFQTREQKCYRVSTAFLLTSRRTDISKYAREPR